MKRYKKATQPRLGFWQNTAAGLARWERRLSAKRVVERTTSPPFPACRFAAGGERGRGAGG